VATKQGQLSEVRPWGTQCANCLLCLDARHVPACAGVKASFLVSLEFVSISRACVAILICMGYLQLAIGIPIVELTLLAILSNECGVCVSRG